MSYTFPVAHALQELVVQTRTPHKPVFDRWMRAGQGPEANVDILLRALEAEQVVACQHYGKNIDGGAFHLQFSLTGMWLAAMRRAWPDLAAHDLPAGPYGMHSLNPATGALICGDHCRLTLSDLILAHLAPDLPPAPPQ